MAYDTVILGGGPAGLAAALYCARYGMKTILVSKEIGGMANMAHKIENYPGYEGSGFELMQKFYSQAKSFGAEYSDGELLNIAKEKEKFKITTSKQKIAAKTVIIALGTQKRKLNIKGEDKFLGRGVSYCATCDGNFFKSKTVGVIGGGDSACKASELLSGIAKKVYMIYRGNKAKCEKKLIKNLQKKKNLSFIFNAIPLEIKGKRSVEEIILEKRGKKERVKLDGVFIEVGSLPVSDIAKLLKLKMDKEGYIHTNCEMETNVFGIFAAGDVVKSKLKQVLVAAAQGAIAAKSAYEFIG